MERTELEYKLAFAVPTYNRSLFVMEFLEQYFTFFYESGIDIYFYDSSEGEDTRVVVEKWNAVYPHIYYFSMPSDCHANRKVRYIFERFGQEQNYDYLWVCGDGVRFSRPVIAQILTLINGEYDMIIVNGADREQIGMREYKNGNQLFQDCAWYMTLFGSVIMNVHSMLKNVPWKELIDKYEIPQRINYSHVGYYFEIIYRLQEFHAFHLSTNSGGVRSSPLKQAQGWLRDTFLIVCEYWPSAIEALPPYYTNKKKVIKKLGDFSCFMPMDFLSYRRENIYNLHTFLKYRKALTLVTSLNQFQLWVLLCMDSGLAYYIANWDIKGYLSEMKKLHALHKYCRKHSILYIYGAGERAGIYADYFRKKNISFHGFIVTTKEGNPTVIQGHQVITLSELSGEAASESGIVISLNERNLKGIQPFLEQNHMWENSYHEYLTPVVLESWKRRKKRWREPT